MLYLDKILNISEIIRFEEVIDISISSSRSRW